MKAFKENDSVIFTDNDGKRIDTFVIFDTDHTTGLTHINYHNLNVNSDLLQLHSRSANGCTMPMNDSFSFELFKQLKEKFLTYDRLKKTRNMNSNRDAKVIALLAKAS